MFIFDVIIKKPRTAEYTTTKEARKHAFVRV